jgi:4-hydroxy-tetrahydrodipicolinate synthase
MTFSGHIPALVTPFRNGKVDAETLKRLVKFHYDQGSRGVVPCGTTGESPTLSHDEHRQVVEIVIAAAKSCTGGNRPPLFVIAGAGSNNTQEAVSLTKHACEAGADGVLVITPYYNKPTQEGLYRHFMEVAGNSTKPIVIYNVPGRTSVAIEIPTLVRLEKANPVFQYVKEASGSLDRVADILQSTGLKVLSGDDGIVLPVIALGGVGVISVVGNLVPAKMQAMVELTAAGKLDEARKIHREVLPLTRAMFVETSPQPVKAALASLGVISSEIRLPMTGVSDATTKQIDAAMAGLDFSALRGLAAAHA